MKTERLQRIQETTIPEVALNYKSIKRRLLGSTVDKMALRSERFEGHEPWKEKKEEGNRNPSSVNCLRNK